MEGERFKEHHQLRSTDHDTKTNNPEFISPCKNFQAPIHTCLLINRSSSRLEFTVVSNYNQRSKKDTQAVVLTGNTYILFSLFISRYS